MAASIAGRTSSARWSRGVPQGWGPRSWKKSHARRSVHRFLHPAPSWVSGIVLGIGGAIMRFALKVRTTGFNIHEAGVILLVVGSQPPWEVWSWLLLGNRSRSTMKEIVQETPTGEVRTQERFDSGSDP
jgi:hypothetical protein